MSRRTVTPLVGLAVLLSFGTVRAQSADTLVERRVEASFARAIDRMLMPFGVERDQVELVVPAGFDELRKENSAKDLVLAFESLRGVVVTLAGPAPGQALDWRGRARLIGKGIRSTIELEYRDTLETFSAQDHYPGYLSFAGAAVESFWESTLVPLLVSLGAVAIVALFFFVRS